MEKYRKRAITKMLGVEIKTRPGRRTAGLLHKSDFFDADATAAVKKDGQEIGLEAVEKALEKFGMSKAAKNHEAALAAAHSAQKLLGCGP